RLPAEEPKGPHEVVGVEWLVDGGHGRMDFAELARPRHPSHHDDRTVWATADGTFHRDPVRNAHSTPQPASTGVVLRVERLKEERNRGLVLSKKVDDCAAIIAEEHGSAVSKQIARLHFRIRANCPEYTGDATS